MKSNHIPEPGSRNDAQYLENMKKQSANWTLCHVRPMLLVQLAGMVWTDGFAQEFVCGEQSLVADIRMNGIHEPLTLFGLLEGNHRLAAAIVLGLPSVPVYLANLEVSNLAALPAGTGARFLECLVGHNNTLIAKQWRRRAPKTFDALVC